MFRAAPLEIPQRGISRFEKLLALADFALRSEPCPLEFSRCCPNQPNPPTKKLHYQRNNMKKRNRKQNFEQRAIVITILIFLLTPLWNDIYNFFRNRNDLILREKYHNLVKAFSDKTSILAIRPLALVPYIPKNPQVEGQRKALIVAEIKIRNKRLANNIRVKFDIDDGAGRRVNSEEWDVIAKQQSLIFSMFYSDVRVVSWSPDIPNDIENIAENREKPFKLWLTVRWEDIDKKEHKLESYSELRYNQDSKLYYFDERENKMLF